MPLLASSPDDPLFGANMALAQGLLSGNFGAGVGGFAQSLAQSKKAALEQQLANAQLENYKSEADVRKLKLAQDARQQAMLAELMGGGNASSGASPNLSSGPMGQAQSPGASAAGGGGLLGLASQLGIPKEAIQADVMFNGGKKVSEFLNSRSTPKWENINGNLVNTAQPGFQGGFQPGFNVSSNGQATMWQPDGKGGLVFGAPQGALATYGAYQDAGESAKARRDLQTVTPRGQNPQMTTRENLVQNVNRITPQEQARLDSDRPAIFAGELKRAQETLADALRRNDQSGASRAQADIAALNREMGRSAPKVGMELSSPEEDLRNKTGVEGDAKANEARSKDVKTAQQFLSVAKQAESVLGQGPTASGVGSLIDKVAGFGGYATPGSVSATQLKTLGGWLTANVPRMEGSQSNFDVGNYQRMASDVGNDMLPLAQRKAALKTIQGMMEGIVKGPQIGGASAEWEPSGKKSTLSGGGWSATRRN